MSDGYAGDLTPKEAWDLLTGEADAQLIDVRTGAEFNFVGMPDLQGIGKEAHGIPWKHFPGMTDNPDFVKDVENAAPGKDAPVLFLCRSGVRSVAAAKAMTELGYTRAYNILGGFEGDKDESGHRGVLAGW